MRNAKVRSCSVSSGWDVTSSDCASCARFWRSRPRSNFFVYECPGSSMAAPLDDEDNVSSFLSRFEPSMAPQCCGPPPDAVTRHRSSRTCGSASIPRLKRRRPGQQMRGNTPSMRRLSRDYHSWYAIYSSGRLSRDMRAYSLHRSSPTQLSRVPSPQYGS